MIKRTNTVKEITKNAKKNRSLSKKDSEAVRKVTKKKKKNRDLHFRERKK